MNKKEGECEIFIKKISAKKQKLNKLNNEINKVETMLNRTVKTANKRYSWQSPAKKYTLSNKMHQNTMQDDERKRKMVELLESMDAGVNRALSIAKKM